MRYGAHLPLIDLDGHGWRPGQLTAYVDTARDLGYDMVSANDHLVFSWPWLDGIVALASVVEHSGAMRVATTVSLPVVRGPASLAKAAAALDIISGGRFVLGVGPGSSPRDFEAAGVRYDERWPRFDEAVRVLRAHLADDGAFAGRHYAGGPPLQPRPVQWPAPPIWIASWGSAAGLRRVARLGDGWLASAYNTTAADIAAARAALGPALVRAGKDPAAFPCSLATMWTYVTGDGRAREARLNALGRLLGRPAEQLAAQVLVGPAEDCAATLRDYADAGVGLVIIWPLAEPHEQLERFMAEVAPLVASTID